ncbi:TetR/AcrR family transcriptional regulator [Massilia sp. MB5]|uniref:TetR/AcrR family transcriptional regulator n=1 Tax=unclassified Massilia TaxID=2609279 RepID=UPI00067AE2E1|nr:MULTISPECIES: TetR/AcrR family transcriptional regulator [unclassified Massilia]AKU24440.1 TetR family transcriptional regulator [Massilia sp. NR 4-1]UMR30560.1 TetR/AcrR family transcriptional regulator [Massilia sp. MB5]
MAKASLREDILQAGLEVMFSKGYGAGVRDIVAAADAPQGSFTNHFRSKEAFAAEVIERYFDYVKGLMAQTLGNESLPPLERIRAYLDLISGKLAAAGWARGCLIGNFSLEAPPQSEALRLQLARIFGEWRAPFAACIAEAQQAGQLDSTLAADDLADFVLAAWQGAMLRMKVEHDPRPLEQFKTVAFSSFLKPKEA